MQAHPEHRIEPAHDASEIVSQADTGARTPPGLPGTILYVTALCWSLFQLWIASPLPFIFNVFIVPETQARTVHLAFAIFLAYTAFPGVHPHTSMAWRLPGWICAAAALASFLYALSLGLAGSPQWLVFSATGVLLALAAYSALLPSPPARVPATDWILGVVAAFC